MKTTQNPPTVPGLAMVAGLVLAAAAIGGVAIFYHRHDLLQPRTARSDPQTQSALADSGSPPLDHDGRLFLLLSQQGLQTSGARGTTIDEAHHVCDRVAGGETEAQIVRNIVDGSPGMSAPTAAAFAEVAISVYCPQG